MIPRRPPQIHHTRGSRRRGDPLTWVQHQPLRTTRMTDPKHEPLLRPQTVLGSPVVAQAALRIGVGSAHHTAFACRNWAR